MKLKCFIDGDALCVVNNDFINLQESLAVFIKLTQEQISEIENMKTEKDKLMRRQKRKIKKRIKEK